MQRLIPCPTASILALALFVGCQPPEATESSTPPANPHPSARASVAPGADAMKLAIITEIHDAAGEHQDQQIEMIDASPSAVIERFNGLDWKHPTHRYAVALSGVGSTSGSRRKLSIIEDLPDGASETVLTAKLEETPPGTDSTKYSTCSSLASPEIALKLLLSFLAEDGEYRTMIAWE